MRFQGKPTKVFPRRNHRLLRSLATNMPPACLLNASSPETLSFTNCGGLFGFLFVGAGFPRPINVNLKRKTTSVPCHVERSGPSHKKRGSADGLTFLHRLNISNIQSDFTLSLILRFFVAFAPQNDILQGSRSQL